MVRVAATEFSKNFGKYREVVQAEPVEVTSHERVTGYFVSPREYEEYTRLKAMQPKAYAVSELPTTTIEAIAASKMDDTHRHLNELLEK